MRAGADARSAARKVAAIVLVLGQNGKLHTEPSTICGRSWCVDHGGFGARSTCEPGRAQGFGARPGIQPAPCRERSGWLLFCKRSFRETGCNLLAFISRVKNFFAATRPLARGRLDKSRARCLDGFFPRKVP